MESTVYITDSFKILGIGIVLVGTVKSGSLKPGMILKLNNEVYVLKQIEMRHKNINEANTGDNIGLTFSGKDMDLLKSIKDKDIILSDNGNTKTSTPEIARPLKPKSFLNSIFNNFKN